MTHSTDESGAISDPPAREAWVWLPQSKPRRVLRVVWRVLRILAFAVAMFWAMGFLANDVNQFCSTVTTTGFQAAVTETCSPPGLNSPITLGFLLLALLLLLPDLSEVGLLGVTLKRQVAVAVESSKRAEQAATSVSTQLSQFLFTASTASASVKNELSIYTIADAQTVTRAAEGAERSGALAGAETMKAANEDELVGRVVRRWAELQELLELDARLRPALDDSTDRASRVSGARLDFVGKWNDELFALRRLRNAAAHGADLDVAHLEDGLALMELLVRECRELVDRAVA